QALGVVKKMIMSFDWSLVIAVGLFALIDRYACDYVLYGRKKRGSIMLTKVLKKAIIIWLNGK
ncbi:hypothetical protein ACJX0J_032585, partial [Zea mays]